MYDLLVETISHTLEYILMKKIPNMSLNLNTWDEQHLILITDLLEFLT